MPLTKLRADRYEGVLASGRTHPLIISCSDESRPNNSITMIVKAIGCPEISNTRTLVCEIMGNLVARQFGVLTPKPCAINVSSSTAIAINRGLSVDGFSFSISPGPAAGCERLGNIAPYTSNQFLSSQQIQQAAFIYVSDMLMQNMDRRKSKVNCGLTSAGLTAFDFEQGFNHLFLPIIGGLSGKPWEPSKSLGPQRRDHLFYSVVKDIPPKKAEVALLTGRLGDPWISSVVDVMPQEWRSAANRIKDELIRIAENAEAFADDIERGLAWPN